jgi:hypothetical protein
VSKYRKWSGVRVFCFLEAIVSAGGDVRTSSYLKLVPLVGLVAAAQKRIIGYDDAFKIRGSCDDSSLSRTSSDRARQFLRRRKNIWLFSNGLSNWNQQSINVGDLRVQEGTTFRLLFASPTLYIILLYFYNSCRAKQQGASRSIIYVSHKGARQPNVDNH